MADDTHPSSLSEHDRENLIAYLDGELEGEAAHALEAKLNRDPEARAEAEAMRRTWDLLDYLPSPEPSASFTHRTLDRVEAIRTGSARARSRDKRWAAGLSWAAAVLLAAGAGYSGISWLAPRALSPRESVDLDQHLVSDLRVIENKRLYEHADDLSFVQALDDPDLFGDDI